MAAQEVGPMTLSLFAPSFKEVRLVLEGPPRTKKTSNRTFDVGRRCPACKRGQWTSVHPSEAWCNWRDLVVPRIKAALPFGWTPIDVRVNCAALFYQDVDRADSHGLYQGLADVLQEAGVVVDDKLIRRWWGSDLFKDSARPRVELALTPIGE
jgi:hypothetical protein